MSELTFYHNPKCSKSRETAKLLEESGKDYITREYLKEPLSTGELKTLFSLLSAEDQKLFVRIKEVEFKENPFDLNDEAAVFEQLAKLPKLMERPIIADKSLAIIGRPTSKLQGLIE